MICRSGGLSGLQHRSLVPSGADWFVADRTQHETELSCAAAVESQSRDLTGTLTMPLDAAGSRTSIARRSAMMHRALEALRVLILG